MPPCPSVQELVAAVKSLTRQNDGTFQNAWDRSFPDAYHCNEQGGFIYVDFPIPATLTRAFIVNAPGGATMNQRTPGPPASIDLNKPGTSQNKVILVANFHTHPLSAEVHGDPQPSRADHRNAYDRGLPGIVISRAGIIGYGPERRISLDNPKGYPGPVSPPGGQPIRFARGPPPPWVVNGRQWPEGTPRAELAAEALAAAGEEQVEDDVIVVEWSADDVSHDVQAEDSED